MPFHRLSVNEIRDYCKQTIESLEYWLRRLIDETLKNSYGTNYFEAIDKDGSNMINKRIRTSIKTRYDSNSDQFSRIIDASSLDDCIDIICNPVLFQKHFREAFKTAFPDGNSRDETRTFLKRLVEPRNLLYHANPISVRQAEQVICYSHDIIASLKKYYEELKVVQNYNVPMIIKITDSFGNEVHSTQIRRNNTGRGFYNFNDNERNFLRPGDTLRLEVEVDSSFPRDSYTINWVHSYAGFDIIDDGRSLVLHINNRCVREDFTINCKVTSKEEWHRCGDCDDAVTLLYKVLPPI
jgi:hypothetical protein